jgi:tetratricopeptide (TPR) repeat protein
VGVGGAACAAWAILRGRPSLEDAIALAEAGRLDEAEARLNAYLARDRQNGEANLLMAQIALRQPDPDVQQSQRRPSARAQVALDHLGRIHPANASIAVTLELGRGRALDRLLRLDEAEAAWLEALRINPRAPEAGWNLLNLYYLQWREEEARGLVLRLYEIEPDPHDRVLLLMELLKTDARPPAPGSIERLFEPVVRYSPREFHTAMALGLAQSRAGKVDEGIGQLRRVVQSHADRLEAWDCLLTALDETGQVDAMNDTLGEVPAAVSESPRLLKHRARVAQARIEWKQAAELYRRAQTAEGYNRIVEYRLSRVLRHLGETAEAERIEQRLRGRDVAIQEIRPLYDQITATPDLGTVPHTELYQRIADVRERMRLPEEARAWHQLVLRDDPKNELSRAALKRLGDEIGAG